MIANYHKRSGRLEIKRNTYAELRQLEGLLRVLTAGNIYIAKVVPSQWQLLLTNEESDQPFVATNESEQTDLPIKVCFSFDSQEDFDTAWEALMEFVRITGHSRVKYLGRGAAGYRGSSADGEHEVEVTDVWLIFGATNAEVPRQKSDKEEILGKK